jgi:N-acetylneuraminate synthase
MKIEKLKIGKNHPPIVIVDIGINHCGKLVLAKKLVDSAIKAGAQIIKHQTHIPNMEMSLEAKKIKPGNSDLSIFQVIKNNCLSLEDEEKLCIYVRRKKKIYISTPFCFEAVDFLEKLNVPAYKIGSGECNNFPLVEYIAKKNKPIILSTGMNSMQTVIKSVNIIKKYNKNKLAILHCTNLYPTPVNLVRLECISQLQKKFKNEIIGLSDHTETNHTSFGAISFGARVIEKHFIDNKKIRSGPDISASADHYQLKDLIEGVKNIFSALRGKKKMINEEKITAKFAFASVVTRRNIIKGELLDKNNITLKRPGTGFFKPNDFKKILGKRAKKNILGNQQLKKNDF